MVCKSQDAAQETGQGHRSRLRNQNNLRPDSTVGGGRRGPARPREGFGEGLARVRRGFGEGPARVRRGSGEGSARVGVRRGSSEGSARVGFGKRLARGCLCNSRLAGLILWRCACTYSQGCQVLQRTRRTRGGLWRTLADWRLGGLPWRSLADSLAASGGLGGLWRTRADSGGLW